MERKGDILYDLLDSNLGDWETYEKVTTLPDGTPLNDSIVADLKPIYRKSGEEYFRKTSMGTRPMSALEAGAKGDGVTDDTAGIQKLLDIGGVIYFPPGRVFSVSDSLVISKAITIIGYGSTIKASSVIGTVFSGSANNVRVFGIEIDGNMLAQRGITLQGNAPVISRTHIHDMYGSTQSAMGILIHGDQSSNVTITENRIQGIHGDPNGAIGDGPGAARGIVIQSPSIYSGPGNTIDNNYIQDIDGEEGDGIHVNFSNVGMPYGDGHVSVSGNKIHNCNRRAIKIQASNVVVSDNIYSTDYELSDITAPESCINVINGSRVIIKGNHLDARMNIYGIEATASEGSKMSGVQIEGNNILSDYNSQGSPGWPSLSIQGGIRVARHDGAVIRGNQIQAGSYAINLNIVTNSLVSENIVTDTAHVGKGIVDDTACSGNTYSLNKGVSDLHRTYFIEVNGDNNFISGNSVFYNSEENFRVVRVTGDRNVIVGSLSNGDVSTNIADGGTNTIVGDNYIYGVGGSDGQYISYRNTPPAAGYHRKGEIVFNRQASGNAPMGWQCVVAGTPGVWATLPLVGVNPSRETIEVTGTNVNLSTGTDFWKSITSNLTLSLSGALDGRRAAIGITNEGASPATVEISGVAFPVGATNEIPAGGRAHISLQQINGIMDASIVIYSPTTA